MRRGLEQKALVLSLEGVQGPVARGLRGPDELVEAGGVNVSVVVHCVFEDADDCLLKRNDLPLKLVFGND